MLITHVFNADNSQAVHIPAELTYQDWNTELLIEREGDELRIRPAQRRMGDVMGKLAMFSSDFMAAGRAKNEQDAGPQNERQFQIKGRT